MIEAFKDADGLADAACAAVVRALWSGIDVRGYFHWSFLDNFEWLEGFAPRFGLFEVDYSTLARRRRPSADLFAELGRSFRLHPDFTPR